VVTHDPRIVPFAKRIVRIEDGSIVGEERRGEGWDKSDDRSMGKEQDMRRDIEDEDSIQTKRVRMQR
jgi:ABC-type lipoprotein export system ATPase subunit